MKLTILACLSLATLVSQLQAAVIFDRGASWKWRPGNTEASTPVETWRTIGFNDSGFTTAPSPFYYGESLTGGTVISGMQNVYGSIFLRKTFVLNNVAEIGGLKFGAIVDDGFVAWINGTEIHRFNMPGGAGTAVTISTLANNATEPVPFDIVTLANPGAYLVPGTNVITVQVFQSALSSSDLIFDASLESIVSETIPPTVLSVSPAPGTVTNLTSVTVTFSEPVSGVAAAHLLVNGIGATSLNAIDSSTYTFGFVQPEYGNVVFTWSASEAIVDQALPPNNFDGTGAGATWNYSLVDNTTPTVAALTPAAGSTVRTLPSIVVLFSEAVVGVDAGDLLINNVPATGVTPVASREFAFTFSTPPTGTVQVAWAPGHGIVDTASPANVFAGGSWTYRLDPNASEALPYISEFLASNTRTNGVGSLIDEDRDSSDWIEIYNPSGVTVNLDGWYLTDNAGNLTKWRFPATNLAGGSFMIVFASAKDRRVPGARLHTSFSLTAGGEYLALVKPDGVTVASEYSPSYPQQVPDVSYGFAQAGNPPGYTIGAEPVYFTTSTPGAVNLGGTAVPGPIIEDVTHTPNVPAEDEDLYVTARIRPSFRAVASVTMRYRIMFNAEVSTPMLDDGAHGDGLAGDGVYGAIIPANLSTNGQMIRYLIAATDVTAGASRWPLFTSPTGSEEYLGTVVKPDYVTSQLPIFHLFVGPTQLAGIDTEAGGRISFFYDGELYDNVFMELRGNTSAGLNKKAHRLEFNRGHELRHAGPGGRSRRSTLLAEKLDPAYLRQHLCFWLLDKLGVPTQYDYPVRLQMNGAFYQLAFHGDVLGQEQMERLGYDPKGALYKAVGNLVPSFASTGGFVKLEPDNDPSRTDYLALANGINETAPVATRRASVFDMLDLPQVINHLAGARWCAENDDVWANMCLYRDTYGDGLWRCIPFDMNASWGQLYGGSDPLEATVDTSKSHPLYGGASTGGNYNRLYDVIVTLPETRQMLLRRQRSLLDMFVKPPGTPADQLVIENYIKQMTNLIHPEALLDRAKWGNSEWAPNKTFVQGVDNLINQFVVPRRTHWYATHSITNTAKPIGIANANNAGIPLAQPGNISLHIVGVDFNPISGNQDQEYICISNPAPFAVDITGWKLQGAVDFTFKPGTVLPSNSVAYVTPNSLQFRARSSGPRGGQGLFVIGGYKGQLSARGETIEVVNDLGAVVHTNRYVGNPSLVQQHLRITEIMFRPSAHPANPDSEQFEYVELRNLSSTDTLNLAGVRFINGIEFSFAGSAVTSLAPGARVLVVKNSTAFNARYGGGLPVAGQFVGSLDNSGERIQLLDATNEEILDFSYNNSWYPVTDGLGFSLAIVDENALPDDWGKRTQWRPSGIVNGTPGVADPGAPVFPGVVVNEVLSGSVLPEVDAIELHNPTAAPADISGWYISDDVLSPRKYRIPAGTTIPAGGFVTFNESQFNTGATAFAFSSNNDEAWVFSGNESGDLTGYAQGFSFGAAEPGVSFGRYTTSTTNVHFVAQSSQSLGSANAGPKVGPVVISEIMYRPIDAGTNDNSADEFIELRNITAAPVALFDAANPANTWKFTEVVSFVFPPNVTLPAGGAAVLVNFNANNPALVAAFRAKYGLATEVPVFGPYTGKLDNNGGRIELKKPGVPLLGDVPYIIADQVEYDDVAPWPTAADGGGPSLQRVNESAYGNDPVNWVAVGPTAGVSYVPGGTPPSVTVQPVSRQAVAGRSASLNVQVVGTAPFFYQWRFNGQNIPGANTAELTLLNVQPNQSGPYTVLVFNSAGSVESASAQLSVVLPPAILQQPAGRNVYIKPDPKAANLPNGTNVTFTVSALSGNSSLTYQWQFNGENIPGATASSLTVTNVQLANEGDYRCLVTDSVDTVATTAARLVPWIAPVIVQKPSDLVIAEGSDFSLSVGVTGNPKRFAYSWRRNIGSVVINTNSGNYSTNFVTLNSVNSLLLLTNNILSSNFIMRIVVYNDANIAPGATTTFNITVLADADRDGIPDVVELGLGLDTNNVADAAGDLDNDGMSNRAEFLAGTDPTNNLSYLKLDASVAAGSSTIQFAAVSNRTYSVQYTDALGTAPWTKLADVTARSTNFVMEIPDPTWGTNRSYRVVLPRQP
jgi:hypothetical protein